MKRARSRMHVLPSGRLDGPLFRTGVSLHSHTMHSREYLGRLPGYIAKIPIASYIIEREVGRLHLYGGRIVDFRSMYWTPPLSPREAQVRKSVDIARLTGFISTRRCGGAQSNLMAWP